MAAPASWSAGVHRSSGPTDEPARSVQLQMVEAVLGGEGLARVARLAEEATGRPVAIVVPRLGAAEVSGADLDREAVRGYVAACLRGAPAGVPAGVVAAAAVGSGDDVVGAVLLGGADGPPGDALELIHAAAVASLAELAVADARCEAEERVRGCFLEDLRSGRELKRSDIVRRAGRLGCDLSLGLVAICAELTTDRPGYVVGKIVYGHPGALAQHIPAAADEAGAGRVYALLPAAGAAITPASTLADARSLSTELRRYGSVGLSSFHADPGACASAIDEAELMLEVVRRSEAPIAERLHSGTYRLLFRVLASHPEELQSLYEDTVAPIVDYDARYGFDLTEMLETYLQENCNMNATATAMRAHRHTVARRLERVKRLCGLDPLEYEDRERLGLGLKIYRITSGRPPMLMGGSPREPRRAGVACRRARRGSRG